METPTALDAEATQHELTRLAEGFFRCVSFERGELPDYDGIRDLFLPYGRLIKGTAGGSDVATLDEFIAPRAQQVADGTLTDFLETELSASTTVFGHAAHRLSVYAKSGTSAGVAFEARGVIFTQFVRRPEGWRISSMAWDDERTGLTLDDLDSVETRSAE
jgi:hypothetical protein